MPIGLERALQSPGKPGIGVELRGRPPFAEELADRGVVVELSGGSHHPGELAEEKLAITGGEELEPGEGLGEGLRERPWVVHGQAPHGVPQGDPGRLNRLASAPLVTVLSSWMNAESGGAPLARPEADARASSGGERGDLGQRRMASRGRDIGAPR